MPFLQHLDQLQIIDVRQTRGDSLFCLGLSRLRLKLKGDLVGPNLSLLDSAFFNVAEEFAVGDAPRLQAAKCELLCDQQSSKRQKHPEEKGRPQQVEEGRSRALRRSFGLLGCGRHFPTT